MFKQSSKNRSFLVRWAALGLAVSAALSALASSVARAEDPKPLTQTVPGTEGVKFDLVPIPGGKFKLGSPEGEKKRNADEGPQAEVTIEPFYMGKYEVTWELYNEYIRTYNMLGNAKITPIPTEKLADAVSYPTPIYEVEAGPRIQRMGGRQGNYPAVIMSHFSAKQFCKWLSAKTGRFYRLPTEAEWEYAARGGTTTAYFFGDDAKKLDDYAWFTDNSELKDKEAGYHEVGQKKPNPFGLYDIYGNVAEIVFDQYDAGHYKSLAGKTVTGEQAVRWPDKQYPRIVRGGGYESDPEMCRSAARQKVTVNQNKDDPQSPKSPYWWTDGFSIGFRIVSPMKEPTEAEKHKYWDVDNETILEIITKDRADRQIRQYVKELMPTTKPEPKK